MNNNGLCVFCNVQLLSLTLKCVWRPGFAWTRWGTYWIEGEGRVQKRRKGREWEGGEGRERRKKRGGKVGGSLNRHCEILRTLLDSTVDAICVYIVIMLLLLLSVPLLQHSMGRIVRLDPSGCLSICGHWSLLWSKFSVIFDKTLHRRLGPKN